MVAPSKGERLMPSRKISYEYTCVMYLAQQFEENMRIILFLGDQWDELPELKLTKQERKLYKDDIGQFLSEKATSGRLLHALVDAGLVRNRSAIEKVIRYRNELAHWFLVEAAFDNLDPTREQALIRRLHEMAVQFYVVLAATRSIRDQFERHSEISQQVMNKMMNEFGLHGLAREAPKLPRKKSNE